MGSGPESTADTLSKTAQERARKRAVRHERGHETDCSWADGSALASAALPPQPPQPPPQLQKFLRKKQVFEATGLSNAELYALISEGRFPKPFKLTGTTANTERRGVVVWVESEVALWQAKRMASRDDTS